MELVRNPPMPHVPAKTEPGSDEFHKRMESNVTLRQKWWEFYRTHPAIFMLHCIKIVDKEANLVPLDIWHRNYRRAQVPYVSSLWRVWSTTGRVRTVVLKARQWGCTTVTQAFILWVMIFEPYTTGIDVADDREGAEFILEMLREMMRNLPKWMKPDTEYAGKARLLFDDFVLEKETKTEWRKNRSSLRVGTARNEKLGRKQKLMVAHGSEAAFWGEHAMTMLGGLMQGIPSVPGTLLAIESTANGWGGPFFDLCKLAESGRGGFEFVFVPWFMIDEYRLMPGDDRLDEIRPEDFPVRDPKELHGYLQAEDYETPRLDSDEITLVEEHGVQASQLLWRKWAIEARCFGDLDLFHQEFPSTVTEAFIATGSPTFNPKMMQYQQDKWVREPARIGEVMHNEEKDEYYFQDVVGGRIKLWHEPEKGFEYLGGVDPAMGSELRVSSEADGDNATIEILCQNTMFQCAEVAGKYGPDETAEILYPLIRYFNQAYAVVENNGGFGSPILMYLKDKEYEHIYTGMVYDHDLKEDTPQLGYNTNVKTRGMMFTTAKAAIRKKGCRIHSAELVDEMRSMINKPLKSGGVRPEARPGAKDDRATNWTMLLEVNREYGERDADDEDERPEVDYDNQYADVWEQVLRPQRPSMNQM